MLPISFNDWSAGLVVRVALGPIPYARKKTRLFISLLTVMLASLGREPISLTLFSLPFHSEVLIYTRLVADIASLGSVGRAPGCSWKNPNVSADTRVSPVQVWERDQISLYHQRHIHGRISFQSRNNRNVQLR